MNDTNEHTTEDYAFAEDTNASIIKVIGVGGGGGNAVNYMYRQDIPNVNFVICNTDQQHLRKSPVPTKLVLGWDVTHGRGAGNVPDVGRQCAEASADDIRKLFEDGTEMVFITAGMGGGTGTGAAPVVAKLAMEAGMLTIGIVTIPFMFEGEKKIKKAIKGAQEMQKCVDALLVINNENLLELYKDLTFFNAFTKADESLANAARSISDIISEECYINVDFEDVKTTLKGSGTAIISTAYGEGKHRITDAIQNAIHSPLLKAHDINTSKRLLFKFACSKDDKDALRAEEIAEIYQFTSKLPQTVDVKWGIADDPSLGSKVKITVLASGFDLTISEENKIENAPDKYEPEQISFGNTGEDKRNIEEQKQNDAMIAEYYGAKKVVEQRRLSAKLKYAVLKPSQFDDHEIISLIENNPTYSRDPRFNERLEAHSEQNAVASPEPHRHDPGSETITFSF